MSAALTFQQLFRDILARQVEYSFGATAGEYTTMIPVKTEAAPRIFEFAKELRYAGQWGWSVERFMSHVRPDALLLRVDWRWDVPVAITIYCRFPVEPDTASFNDALRQASPFSWSGPDPSALATALNVGGPRGIAFRAKASGARRSALYFKSEAHTGRSWRERLPSLLDVCKYPESHAVLIENVLRDLYGPGPAGVVGIDEGQSAMAGALKFDPCEVPLESALAFLKRIGAPESRRREIVRIARGLRARSVSYVGVQFNCEGLAGWRLYFACEPGFARPEMPAFVTQRNLMPIRRLPHY